MGVGGEYPVASASAAERAEGNPETRLTRGETVVLTFSQQGWGSWANGLVILLLLAVTGATGQVITQEQAEVVWRVQFAVGTFFLMLLTAYRWTCLEESEVWKVERREVADELEQEGVSG